MKSSIAMALALTFWPSLAAAAGTLKVNREYYESAAKTGGDYYFWAPGEFASSSLDIPIHHDEVLLAYGSADGKRVIEVPVETGIRTLTLFSGLQRKDLIAIIGPDGTALRHGPPDVRLQSFQHMAIATIEAPAAGMWKLELHGAGAYSVSAHVRTGQDGITFLSADFVEVGGRPGHEGLFPIKREAKRGETLTCRLRLSGSASDVKLTWVAEDGTLIASTSLEKIGDDEYLGPCVVPDQPFRIGVTGIDPLERRFDRVERGLREPK